MAYIELPCVVYSHSELCVTPKMTSATTPSPCAVTVSGENEPAVAGWKGFDQTGKSAWRYDLSPAWIVFDLGDGNERVVNCYTLTDEGSYLSWKVYGSNNGSDWTLLDDRSADKYYWNAPYPAYYGMVTLEFSNSTAYRYYKWEQTYTQGGYGFRELELIEIPTYNIEASLSLPLSISGYLVDGYPGDMDGTLAIPLSISGTFDSGKTIQGSLSIPLTISGTIENSYINAGLVIPLSVSGTMFDINYPINGGLSLSLSVSGTVYVYPVYDSLLCGNIPSMEMSASAIVDTIGNGCINIPALTMSATGLTSYVGNATITLPRLTVTASAMRTLIGAATLKLPALRTSASTLLGIVANGEITIPMLRVSADSYRSVIATATVTLPSLKLDAVHIPSSYINMVMNVRNAALTLYTNYSFNSLCHFDGKNLGATATGVYDLDLGDTDAGVAIDWNFKTGYLDLHLKTKKKLREAWLGCKASGDMIVTLTDTDGTAYEYEAKSYEETERGLRVKFGRGYHRRYLSMDVQNLDGGNITLDTIRLILDKYGGRR